MEEPLKITVSLFVVGTFGVFLIWQGVTNRILRMEDGRTLFPRWMYVASGLAVLTLPVLYLLARLVS